MAESFGLFSFRKSVNGPSRLLKFSPLKIIVLSQVVLSFTLPFALAPLVILTRREQVMGDLVNNRRTNALAYTVTAVIIVLNVLLLYQQFGGQF